MEYDLTAGSTWRSWETLSDDLSFRESQLIEYWVQKLIDPFEAIIEKVKEEQGVTLDKDLSVESLKKLVELFKAAIKEQTGQDFPTNPIEQLWGAICAVFRSWMNERAILYRKMEGIPDEWGTAVSVMAMW